MIMTDEEKSSLQGLLSEVSEEAPRVGKKVKVVGGRKHRGKEGIVFWHGADRFSYAGRYFTGVEAWMVQARGKYGYRVGIRTETGEKFFVPADQVEVVGKGE